MKPLGRLLSPRQAAAKLTLSVDVLLRHAKAGTLPSFRIGDGPKARYRFSEHEIDAWLLRRREGAREKATPREVLDETFL